MHLLLFLAQILGTETSLQPDGGLRAHVADFSLYRSSNLGAALARIDDRDGDGQDDLLVAGPRFEGKIHVMSSASWQEIAQMSGSFNQAFGEVVAPAPDLDGDGIGDFYVAAELSNFFFPGEIAAFTGLTPTARAWTRRGPDGAALGAAMVTIPDLDGDGIEDLAAGAPCPGQSGGYVFILSGKTGAIIDRIGPERDGFGSTLARSDDLDGDGLDDLLIGAPLGVGHVAAYSSATRTRIYELHGAQDGQEFGKVIQSLGDIDRDGIDDFCIGSPASSTLFRFTAEVTAHSGATGNLLWGVIGDREAGVGVSLGRLPDIDGDGIDDLMVGAPSTQRRGGQSLLFDYGAVYMLSGANGEVLWEFVGTINQGEFGYSTLAMGDVNGDGLEEIVIATPDFGGADPQIVVVNLNPFMTGDQRTVSLATGGQVTLGLDYPLEAAHRPYSILMSARGVGPTFLNGAWIPLTRDPLFEKTRTGVVPFGQVTGMSGFLDASGDATATLDLPPSAGTWLGSIWISSVVNPLAGQPVTYASAATRVELIP